MTECEFYLNGCEKSETITGNARMMNGNPKKMVIYLDYCLDSKENCDVYSGLKQKVTSEKDLLKNWGPIS